MKESNSSDIENPGLSEQDYYDHFIISPKKLVPGFLVILALIGVLLYWFQSTMQSNSNLKVQQGKQILKRAENLSDTTTALTVELEQFAHETDDERNKILRELTADSFPSQFNRRLKNRFLRSTTYLTAPSNWKNQLPPKLKQWAQMQRNRRIKDIRNFFQFLRTTMNELDHRIKRLKTVRKEKNLKAGQLGNNLHRYDNLKAQLQKEIQDVRERLQTVQLTSPDIPSDLFKNINDLIDPMTSFAMHTRNFSAFSSAPAAYYHAYRIFHDAIRIDPNNPAPYYWLGKLFRELQLHNVAGQFMARALHYDSNFKREAILSHLRKRLKEKPNSPQRNYYLAFAQYEAGLYEPAEKTLRTVLRLERGTTSMMKVLARKRLNYIRNGEPFFSKLPLF
jgi:tetratricopeptide (TPR) repeat protein